MITEIQNLLSKHNNKIKLLWVPGYAEIEGNEMADKRAKAASKEALHMSAYFTTKDIKSMLNNTSPTAL